MASVRKNAITQLKTTLGTLVPATLKVVSYDPQALANRPELPAAWIVNEADEFRDLAGVVDTYVGASSLIRIYGSKDANSVIEELEDMAETVIDTIVAALSTFRGLTPGVHITSVTVATDPVEEFQRDIYMLTIRMSYRGTRT